MTDEQRRALAAIHDHLDKHPEDWDTRLVLADLLAECSDNEREACQRWMAENHQSPCSYAYGGIPDRILWAFYSVRWTGKVESESAVLSNKLFGELVNHWKGSESRQAAEDALLAALKVVHPEIFGEPVGKR